MIKLFTIFLIISVIATGARREEKITLPIQDRINLLKYEISEQVKAVKKKRNPMRLLNEDSQLHPFVMRASDVKKPLNLENYDYVNLDDQAITPIMDFDHRKKDHHFHLRELKTTTTKSPRPIHYTPHYYKPRVIKASFQRPPPLRSFKFNTTKNKYSGPQEKPVDDFYRRQVDPTFYYTPMKWLHCEDLITPLITGLKTECVAPKFYESNNRIVTRLIQLLTINTTSSTKEEIFDLLLQVSNIQIRFFQWNSQPMRILLDTITGSPLHSFRILKFGIKRLFDSWHLDFSNATNLLKQSRLFRPYCINVGHHGGSTKSSKNTRYSISTESTTKCTDSDDSAQTTIAGE
ncbi:uncharacterized protein LOC113234525 [Hyposmocoma kahamanoa]|uniref:uncharacterized protein LOC113234525 n=1 Tax=Hyposmocoma kahamanoa TaxID=1477025 RepID=UPI000E6D8926|nr:uncharacterized protein LOC113234525 [Hyposmocoma kahamanoa]